MPDEPDYPDHPTWERDIRHFFRPRDIECMGRLGFHFGTLKGVREHSVMIFQQVSDGYMPPDEAGRWSETKVKAFFRWMRDGHPETEPGTATGEGPTRPNRQRVRRNARDLDQREVKKLAKAFATLQARGPEEVDSWFRIGGLHGRPNLYCQHHYDPYNPWHRVYLTRLEDALRKVPGCEDVTLPYWDYTFPLPEWLHDEPFSFYEFPEDVEDYKKGDRTQRISDKAMEDNMNRFDFFGDLNRALPTDRWGQYVRAGGMVGDGYQLWSIQAHDSGHNSLGPTMQNQDYASFDPIFWFYHCNLDRHWLSWQRLAGGTDWSSFEQLLDDARYWEHPLDEIVPFIEGTAETIDFGIEYDSYIDPDAPVGPTKEGPERMMEGEYSEVAVRVEGIERLGVSGSFIVDLLADGERIASRGFFQPSRPKGCATCESIPQVGLEMRVPTSAVAGKTLSIAIEQPGDGTEKRVAVEPGQVGNPTITVVDPGEDGESPTPISVPS